MKLLREPMLHFAIAGALLFAADAFLNRDRPASEGGEPIRIGEGEVRWLHETFANQWRRPPSGGELSGMVATLIEEELLAREARALGLDRDDTVVRRRLAQKLGFLVEGTSQLAAPAQDDLRRFYAANIARFTTAARVSFTQIFFSTERRPDAEADARAALISVSMAGGKADPGTMGDPLLLEESFRDIEGQALSSVFGAEFANAVFELEPGSWHGPIRSTFGLHLVEVTRVLTPEVRPFETVRAAVEQEWRRDREKEIRAAFLAKLRGKYGVAIEDRIKPILAAETGGNAAR